MMGSTVKVRTGVLLLACSLGAAVALAGPANASVGDGNCDGNEFCVFDYTGGESNPTHDTRSSNSVYSYYDYDNIAVPLDNSVSYIINRTGWTLGVWIDESCEGPRAKIAGSYNSPNTAYWNNVISSHGGYDAGC